MNMSLVIVVDILFLFVNIYFKYLKVSLVYGNRASKAFIHLFAIASAFVSQLDFLHKSESLWSNFSSNSFSQSLFFISKPFVFIVIVSQKDSL